MNSSINLTEILIVNCAGIFCMLFLFYSKYSNKSVRRVGDILYDCLIALTIIMLSLETVSFYWDGAPGKAVYVMQSIVNALLIVGTTITGYLWCLFVEFKIHHSLKLVRKRACFLVIPILINSVFVILDCFGTGIMFSISEQNVYQRGHISVLSYIFLAFYYIYSICIVYRAKHRGTQMRFFPVYSFVLPCVFGTCVQGLQYGISTGWFAVAMALMCVEFQLQKEEAFVDDLSGLYNRKYLDFYFSQMLLKKNSGIYGIMMDINLFKKINDVYGHATGGIFNREHIARFAEGNKAEAVIPLENAGAMQPFVDAVANGITASLMPIVANISGSQSQLQPLYVGTLIADERGLKELNRKMQVIQLQDNKRRG